MDVAPEDHSSYVVSMNHMLFVDLDGVLADFDRGVFELTGSYPNEMHPRKMWPRLATAEGFYAHLPWMPDGVELWNGVKHHDPVILTGLPMGKWAEPQKRTWCSRELGPEIPVITCMSRDKAQKARDYVGPSIIPILIDDRIKLKEAWEAMGGVFIHHTSAAASLKLLSHVVRS